MDNCYSGSSMGWVGPTGSYWRPPDGRRPSLDELTLTILVDHLGDTGRAIQLCQSMKQTISHALPEGGGTLTAAQLDAAIADIEAETTKEA